MTTEIGQREIKELTKGHVFNIGTILDEFVTPEDFLHIHPVIYPQNLALDSYIRRAIRESKKPVLAICGNQSALLPISDLSDSDIKDKPYVQTSNGLLIRLDALPPRYFHNQANDGGLADDDKFMEPYYQLKAEFEEYTLKGRLRGPELEALTKDPSIIGGARRSVFPQSEEYKGRSTINQAVEYVLKANGWFNESWSDIRFSSVDHAMVSPPAGFNYSQLIPLIKELGGWIDFRPGHNEQGARRHMRCNFTTIGTNEYGEQLAIVQKAAAGDLQTPVSANQIRFIDKLSQARIDKYLQ